MGVNRPSPIPLYDCVQLSPFGVPRQGSADASGGYLHGRCVPVHRRLSMFTMQRANHDGCQGRVPQFWRAMCITTRIARPDARHSEASTRHGRGPPVRTEPPIRFIACRLQDQPSVRGSCRANGLAGCSGLRKRGVPIRRSQRRLQVWVPGARGLCSRQRHRAHERGAEGGLAGLPGFALDQDGPGALGHLATESGQLVRLRIVFPLRDPAGWLLGG